MSGELTCFKAYDIRGRIPDELNEKLAYRIGRAFTTFVQPRRVAVGHDVRLSSPALSAALARGLLDGGAEVWDIGLCGTEEIYFATFHHRLDGGIMVTASHNPMDYNGMKLVREQARPISGDSGLFEIRDLAEQDDEPTLAVRPGKLVRRPSKRAYIHHLLGYLESAALRPLK
ncbi:MAG: phosphomannomutase, partial [Candidatus Competibacteraceae bacterium]